MVKIRLTAAALALLPALVGCGPAPVCPAIANFRGVTVVVAADLAPRIGSLAATACQSGSCTQETLVLASGSVPLPARCALGREEPCQASPIPNGTLVGNFAVSTLTGEVLEVTLTGIDKNGIALPARSIAVRPVSRKPFGEDCPSFGPQASLCLDSAALTECQP